MRGIVLGIGLAMLAGQAVAGSYVLVSANGKTVDLVDVGSIKRAGDVVSYWDITLYHEPQRVGNFGLADYMTSRFKVDCVKDEATLGFTVFYRANGEVVTTSGGETPVPLVPNSIGEAQRNATCSPPSPEQMVNSDPQTLLQRFRAK